MRENKNNVWLNAWIIAALIEKLERKYEEELLNKKIFLALITSLALHLKEAFVFWSIKEQCGYCSQVLGLSPATLNWFLNSVFSSNLLGLVNRNRKELKLLPREGCQLISVALECSPKFFKILKPMGKETTAKPKLKNHRNLRLAIFCRFVAPFVSHGFSPTGISPNDISSTGVSSTVMVASFGLKIKLSK